MPAPPSEICVDNYQHSGIVDDANLSLSPRLNNAAYMTGFEQVYYGDKQPLSVQNNRVASISGGFENYRKKNLAALGSQLRRRDAKSGSNQQYEAGPLATDLYRSMPNGLKLRVGKESSEQNLKSKPDWSNTFDQTP